MNEISKFDSHALLRREGYDLARWRMVQVIKGSSLTRRQKEALCKTIRITLGGYQGEAVLPELRHL